MTKRKLKKTVRDTIWWSCIIVLLCVIAYCAHLVVPWLIANGREQKAVNETRDLVHQHALSEKQDDTFSFTHAAWQALKDINDGFRAYIAYDDEFISEPIVQGTDNEYYLNHWIDGSWANEGTFFFDCTNEMEDTNLTIYGHSVFYTLSASKMTPMRDLLDQEAYLKHPEFNIWYEDEVARYVITNIYYWDAIEDRDFAFTQRNFSSEAEFAEYTAYIDSRNLIEPLDKLEYGDRFVSIQTCRDLESNVRIIYTCKEISRKSY